MKKDNHNGSKKCMNQYTIDSPLLGRCYNSCKDNTRMKANGLQKSRCQLEKFTVTGVDVSNVLAIVIVIVYIIIVSVFTVIGSEW